MLKQAGPGGADAGVPGAGPPAGLATFPAPPRRSLRAGAVAMADSPRTRVSRPPATTIVMLPASIPAMDTAQVLPAIGEDPAPVPPQDVADGGEVDGRTLRNALAAMAVGAVADRMRPSRLLGGAASDPLLGGTLDGLWGLAPQAAMSLIVGGGAPGARRMARGAARVVAAAANRQMASLMEDATRYGVDNAIPFLRNLEVAAEWYPGARPSLEARTIDTLFQSQAMDHTVFLQASVQSDIRDTTANIGIGYRYRMPDSPWMLGVNAFYDRAFQIGHERMSIGLEASNGDFTVFGNRYVALSGWTGKNADFDERPLSGWDAGLAGPVPGLEDLTVSLAAFRWEQHTEHDRTGLRLTADYDVSPALQFGAMLSADDSGDVRAGLRLSFQFGADAFGGNDVAPPTGRDRRLDFVNRDNHIRTEKRAVPHDYAIQFSVPEVDASNQSSLAFALSGAPLSSRYDYQIVSSGGGDPIVGSGPVAGDPQPVSGIDVSGLPDGTLTVTLQVTSKQGAHGPKVTAQIAKSTAALGVSTSTPSADPTNLSPIAFTIRFSQPVSGFELSDLAVTNGTATNLRSSDNATWTVDVSPAGQGAVELAIPAGVATGSTGAANGASNATRVVYDSAGPAGYAVAFLASPHDATGFEISGAELGSAYSFTISSSAGGAPVTGSGVIAANRQQVSGLDLSGLPDGTLTLSLTLTDALGNAGAPATDTLAKTGAGPVIIAVTPPAAGDYDDL